MKTNKQTLAENMAPSNNDILNKRFRCVTPTGATVEIRPDGWDIVESASVVPSKNGDFRLLKKYVNLSEEQQLLFLVTLASCFIPDIGHPVMHMSGSRGSGKTVLAKLVRSLLEPSTISLSKMPSEPGELEKIVDQRRVVIIDNLTSLSPDECSLLCSLTTGGSVGSSLPVFILTSIGALHSQPAFTERSISFYLQSIKPANSKTEAELLQAFSADLPMILGGCFDLLAGAMRRLPDVNLPSVPRMFEYAKWGYAIAEEMGPGLGDQFLTAYVGNLERQKCIAMIEDQITKRKALQRQIAKLEPGLRKEVLDALNSLK